MRELVFNHLRWFPALLSVLVFTTCIKDPELPEKEYPMLYIREVTDISLTGATLHAEVLNCASKITEYGFLWGLNPQPEFENQSVMLTGEPSDFSFRITTGIRENLNYYVRAYAKTPKHTVFSNIVSFKSQGSEGDINITTDQASYVTAYSAVCGGNILEDGFSDIINRGLVWGTSENPSLADHLGMTRDGEGLGAFANVAIGLASETNYFIRAYAINNKDTAYGNTISFITLKNYIVYGEGVTDIDGNNYPSVIIGNQEWMAKNLRTTKYRDGQSIHLGIREYHEGYTIYPHSRLDHVSSSSAVLNAYGALYNFYAVTDQRGLCPAGWRVPTEDDFMNLRDYVIATVNSNNDPWHPNGVGSHLRSSRQVNSPLMGIANTTIHPRWHNTRVTYGRDTFGFSALPGGSASPPDYFYEIGYNGSWWTSTRIQGTYGLAFKIDFYYNNLGTDGYNWTGRSVRCIKE